MNFRIQEIIKILIPGIVLIISIYLLSFNLMKNNVLKIEIKDYLGIYIIVFLAIVYVTGYFIDWFGSLFERLFYKVWARPSYYLLNGIKGRINLLNATEIVEHLCDLSKRTSQNPLQKKNAEELFKIANYLKDKNSSQQARDKVNEFYFSKIFSRNLSVSFLIAFLFYLILYFSIKKESMVEFNFSSFILVVLGILTVLRWQEHAFYYSRNVLYAACEDILKL